MNGMSQFQTVTLARKHEKGISQEEIHILCEDW